MGAINIQISSLVFVFLLLIVPLILNKFYRLHIGKSLFYSTLRMTIQLILIGIFLKYLFLWNNPFLNVLWLTIMILVAVFTTIHNTSLKVSKILIPTFISFAGISFIIVLFLNTFVIKLNNIFDARYLIVLGGMLLGNSLRGNIIGISSFYNNIKNDSKKFMYTLSLGASFDEAILPYISDSIQLALKPSLAAMATIGIVSLPGMMTGVILGGTDPVIAIKYQMMIMIGIIVSTITSVLFTILLTMKNGFSKYGILNKEIFR